MKSLEVYISGFMILFGAVIFRLAYSMEYYGEYGPGPGLLPLWTSGLIVVLAAINIYYLVQFARQRHDASKYEILSVAGDDTYLRHVVRTHDADIRRFNPGWVHDPFAADDAYLVLQGDETVGVVIVHEDAPGEAQIVLDYVTERYRDRSPGEFVFGEDGPFRTGKYHLVRTPPGMVSPYYERLGFAPEGDRYSLRVA